MSRSPRPAGGLDAGADPALKYRLVQRLGIDGAIERYLAEHTAIGRPVELHRLTPEASDDDATELLRSAKILGGATHRNVQGVVDTGKDAAGRPYVVLEALRGRSLAEILADSSSGLHPLRAARVTIQILEALRALHEHGVILRALTPSEVNVEPGASDQETVKLRGVARAALMIEGGAERIDEESPYFAPELGRGEPGLDPRVDVYSVGMILRALATGSPRGDIAILADAARRAITRATASDREERFASADAMLSAVALLLPDADRAPRAPMPTPSDPLLADLSYLRRRRTTFQRPREPRRGESRLTLLVTLLTIEAIYRRFGSGVWGEITARVRDAETLLPGAGNTPAHVENGVPVSLFTEILSTVDEVAGQGDLSLVAELGEAVAQRGLRRLFPDLPEPLAPETIATHFAYLWGRIARDGKARVTRLGARSYRLGVEGQGTPSLELAGLVAALLRQCLREAGATSAEVAIVASEALGDPRDLYRVDWTE